MRQGGRRTPAPGADVEDVVLGVLQEHAGSLLATARRHSYCLDDAHDAYQRAIEILLRRADSLDPEGIAGWLHTVVRHEAVAVRRQRARLLAAGEVDPDRHEADDAPPAEERAVRFERVTRAAEALRRCKPDEARALVLKAQGLSYAEIAELNSWTYTKVNRTLTEGRKRFLERYAGIEAGAECERWAAAVSAIADREATADQLSEARPHLRNCAACRATLRELHEGSAAIAAVVPLAGLAAAGGGDGGAAGLLSRIWESISTAPATVAERATERAAVSAQKLQLALDGALSGKVAAVAVSAAALAGGGGAVLGHVGDGGEATPARGSAAAPAAARAPLVDVPARGAGAASTAGARTQQRRGPAAADEFGPEPRTSRAVGARRAERTADLIERPARARTAPAAARAREPTGARAVPPADRTAEFDVE
jgi:RNA polymerase sigma factor (sigma-70 family)